MSTIPIIIPKSMKNSWIGKKILITGGTAGLGKALTEFFLLLDADVAIVARSEDKLQKLKQEYPDLVIIKADVSNIDDIHKISGQTLGQFEKLDLLINNASYLGQTPLRSLIDTECEQLQKVLETNLMGPFRLIKAILPSMLLGRSGLIINISSDASIAPYPTWGGYGISKAALDHMTHIWKEELQESGIQMISIDPGDMNTSMHLAAIPDANVEELHHPAVVARDLITFITKYQGKLFSQGRYTASEWRNEL